MKFYKLETDNTLQLWEGLPDKPLYEGHDIKPHPEAVEVNQKQFEKLQKANEPDSILEVFEKAEKVKSNNGKKK